MSTTKKSLLAIVGLIMATTAALAAMGAMGKHNSSLMGTAATTADDLLSVSTEVVQEKVLKGGDGRVTVSLNLSAAHLSTDDGAPLPPTDMVIVLDRSGSMEGRKLSDARQAVIDLLDQLGTDDRLALMTYSSGVQVRSELVPMNTSNRQRFVSALEQVHAGGGTNLGAGLSRGIDTLLHTSGDLRQRKVILISDGLANQGVTSPDALGRMASDAVNNRFSISTVGVGLDFNEVLMTAIADQGAGQYHFLEDPKVLARMLETELHASRHVAAAGVRIKIPEESGVRLVEAGGYPIRHENGTAIFHPGNLLSGQSRNLYLTFQVPTDVEKKIVLGQIQVSYQHQDQDRTMSSSRPLTVACVADSAAVVASIKKEKWENQVVEEEFNRLKEAVAADIRAGDRGKAHTRIEEYEDRQTAINTVVGSGKVAQNLDTDISDLRLKLDKTFTGAPAAVAEKKKQASKSLQYESYQIRRSKQ